MHLNYHRPKITLTNSTWSTRQYTCTRPYIPQNHRYLNNFRVHILESASPSGAASLASLSLRRTRNRTEIFYRGRCLNALHKHNCGSSNKSLNENAAGAYDDRLIRGIAIGGKNNTLERGEREAKIHKNDAGMEGGMIGQSKKIPLRRKAALSVGRWTFVFALFALYASDASLYNNY